MAEVVEITGDQVVERNFTPAERKQHEKDLAEGAAQAKAEAEAAEAAAAAKQSARAKLAALGLTEAEIAALIGG